MYLNPLRDFIEKFANQGSHRTRRGGMKARKRILKARKALRSELAMAVEVCEPRALLSGPALVTISPNTGGYLNLISGSGGTVENTAPNQLTFTFSPSTSIYGDNAPGHLNNLTNNITISRSGGDGVFSTAASGNTISDLPVQIGSMQVNAQNPNIVTLNFGNTLVTDTYEIAIGGGLQSTTGAFNNGQTQYVDFTVDFGAQVVSVVPQPVLRTTNLNVAGNAPQTADGQTFKISMGGGTAVNFELKDTVANTTVVPAGTIEVDYSSLSDTASTIAASLAAAINTAATSNSSPLYNTLVTPVTANGSSISLTGVAFSPAVKIVTPTTLAVSAPGAGSVQDQDTFTITSQNGTAVTFEFLDTTQSSVLTPGDVAINFNPADSATLLAQEMAIAINGSALGAGTVGIPASSTLTFAGSPAITQLTSSGNPVVPGFTISGGLATTDGGITQATNVVVVYFSQDPLVPSLATNPAFYQVNNTLDGSILQPDTVKYDAVGHTAVLNFKTALPSGTLHLTVGAPLSNNITTGTATVAGNLYAAGKLSAVTGALNWTNSSNQIAGVGTLFSSQLKVGQFLVGPDGLYYQIASIVSNTSLKLVDAFAGATQTGVTSWAQAPNNAVAPLSGVVTWVKNSPTVTGVGTSFKSELKIGQLVLGPNQQQYTVESIQSDTTLVLTSNYAGITASNLTWTNGSTTLTGLGTKFTSASEGPGVGGQIQGPNGNVYTVQSITDDFHLTLTAAFGGPTTTTVATTLTAPNTTPLVGTTIWTTGRTLVSGNGTHFTTDLHVGSMLLSPDGNYYRVGSIANDLQLSITTVYTGESTPLGFITNFTSPTQLSQPTYPFTLPGTTNWTNQSAAVTTQDMNFLDYLRQGDTLLGPDNAAYTVAYISPDGSTVYLGQPGIAGVAPAALSPFLGTSTPVGFGASTNYSIGQSPAVTPLPIPGGSIWGPVSGVAGSSTTTVISTGVNYNAYLTPGDFVVGPDGLLYGITAISSDGMKLTLNAAYSGSLEGPTASPNTLPGSTVWTNGTSTVSGIGVTYTLVVNNNQYLVGPDGNLYKILDNTLNGGTTILLASTYTGPSTSSAGITTSFLPVLPNTSNWTSGSSTVTSNGFNYRDYVSVGEYLTGPDGQNYAIAAISVDGATITLGKNFTGVTGTSATSYLTGVQTYYYPISMPGTTEWTNGSSQVTGNGTNFLENLNAGNTIVGPDGFTYRVQSVNSNTLITLTSPFNGLSTTAPVTTSYSLGIQPFVDIQASQQSNSLQNSLTGTTYWTHNSATVIGLGTRFTKELAPGYMLTGPDGLAYTIDSINSDTQLTLRREVYHGNSTPLGDVVSQVLPSAYLPVPGTTSWSNGQQVVQTTVDLRSTLQPGYSLLGPDGNLYQVASVTSTQVTLTGSFAGTTVSGANAAYLAVSQIGQTTQAARLPLAGTTTWTNGTSSVATSVDLSHFLVGDEVVIGPDGNFYQVVAGSVTSSGFAISASFTGATQSSVYSNYLPNNSFTTVGYLGDGILNGVGINNNINAVNLYAFQIGGNGQTATFNISNLASTLGGAVTLRLFNSAGAPVAVATNNGVSLTTNPLAAGTYYLGVSTTVNTSYDAVNGPPAVAVGSNYGSYRLTTNVNYAQFAPNDTTSFATASNTGVLGTAGLTINGTIAPIGGIKTPPLPGGSDTPGNRNTQLPSQANNAPLGTTATLPQNIPVVYYNFQTVYGTSAQGVTLTNEITDNQKQDARQIFDMYGQIMGIKFIETASSGITVATGDITSYAPTVASNLLPGITYIPGQFTTANHGEGSVVVVSAFNPNLNYGASPYGGAWFNLAYQYIGEALGLSPNNDAPGVMNGIGDPTAPISTSSSNITTAGQAVNGQPNPTGSLVPGTEPVYPGDIATVPAQVINAPDSTDLNLYQFQVTQAGTFSAETIAQRLKDANGNAFPSTLDTVLTLYSAATATATANDTFNVATPGFTMTFTAKAQGLAGNGLNIVFSKAALAQGAGPTVNVVGNQISVVLNTTTPTTASQLITALQNNILANNLVTATATINGVSNAQALNTNITTPAFTPATSSITLAGGAGSRTVLARNDNYFGSDSFVSLHLNVGTYYIAVSSTGNTAFDPSIADSGNGGTTDGCYQLQMNFIPDAPSSATLNDAGLPNAQGSGGVALDGDGQGRPGGTFNFWFQSTSGGAGTTIFVDKHNSNDFIQDGSLQHPYSGISAALAAAAATSSTADAPTIVRIEGNGGFDGNLSSTADSLPYLIGTDSLGNPESDGTDFVIPQGVTVMIDAGAVIKLHSAVVDVGNSTPNVNRSGAALQVLGTPEDSVIMTSLFNDAIGGRSDPLNFTGVMPGDWGGIVFQQPSDVQSKDWHGNGIFLDSVNQSNLTYGGGKVTENGVLQSFAPIYITNSNPNSSYFARPSIWFNTITLSAGAALSADPNSFADTFDRIGPDVYGNYLSNNSINGFFIRVQTDASGLPVDTLGISARIDDNDITFVLTQNLVIDGNPGGAYEPDPTDPLHTGWQARMGATLIIDPGVVLKLSGATIQTQIGQSQLIAEGTSVNPIYFTSLADDTIGVDGVGAGFQNLPGTFDTNGDGTQTSAKPGDWGGLFFNSDSKGSIDHAVIQYAGGTAPIANGLDSFNAIEIQQAQVRVADSLFQFNLGGTANTLRDGLLGNTTGTGLGATIFIRGAQPVIVDNVFISNAGSIISANVNSLNADIVPDWGRSTGDLQAFTQYGGNHGPLVALNVETGNGINGMEVRAEEITTQTYWDDADIVHVVTGEIDDAINQHTFGGITLESSVSSSMVVKLLGATAGFYINGIPLDYKGRIGGALQLIGTSNNPVILTSLYDNSVGAGFQPNGQVMLATWGGANPGAKPGDWNSVTLGQYSNDTNVTTVVEQQPAVSVDNNSTPTSSQALGSLAPNQSSGTDNQPIGFSIQGTISQPSDVDVYSFTAQAGTEVWFQVGLSSPSLASVLELVDSNGNVLASSNPQQSLTGAGANLTGLALTMMKDPSLGGAFYSSNPRDAGMRVVLPGTAGTSSTYYIRIRSDQAQTQGGYTLQVRLQQQWEMPGSLLQYSTINYATNGIQVEGLPGNSPLSGTSTSAGGNNSFANAQNLGNLLASSQGSLSVSGTLNQSTQVDWYSFSLNYDLVQAFSNISTFAQYFSTVFDVDYGSSATGGPDTTLSVFDQNGNLIYVARNGANSSDQPQPLQGNGQTNLAGGSSNALDPYLGPVELPAGYASSSIQGAQTFNYYVAISSNTQLPAALNATFPATSNSTNAANVRLQPVQSMQRIVDDHIGSTGYSTGNLIATTGTPPISGAILPIANVKDPASNVVPYTLSDVIAWGTDSSGNLNAFDPSTGGYLYTAGNLGGNLTTGVSIKARADGTLWAYIGIPGAQNVVGRIVQIDPGTGATTSLGTDAIQEFSATDPNTLSSDKIDSFAWENAGPGGADSPGTGDFNLYLAADDTFGEYGQPGTSRLYEANPNNGNAVVSNTPYHIRGSMVGPLCSGSVTGMEFVTNPATGQQVMFAVTSGGQLATVNLFSGALTLVHDYANDPQFAGKNLKFTGLTLAPQNLSNPADSTQLGWYANMLLASYATTSGPNMMLVAPYQASIASAALQNGLKNQMPTVPIQLEPNLSNPTALGMTISPLDVNLWHPTGYQSGAAGHGAGNSYYFGIETPGSGYLSYNYTALNAANAQFGTPNAQFGVTTGAYQRTLTEGKSTGSSQPAFDTLGAPGNNYNLPGGAHGSMVTDSFNLAGYSAGDLPTLYFNYMLGSDSTAGADIARVFASSDGGTTWQEIATSNVSSQGAGGELPSYVSTFVSANSANATQQMVQPLFNDKTFRQARIDLSNFAGQGNVKLRFDFSTSGTTYNSLNGLQGLPGDNNGVGPTSAKSAQSNNFIGFFIGNIIVGFASRGEMVTGSAASGTGFFQTPTDPSIGQSLTGPYQLEIRPGQMYQYNTPDQTGAFYADSGFFPSTTLNNPGQFIQTSINAPLNFGTAAGYAPYNYTPTAWNLGTETIRPIVSINQRLAAGYTFSAPSGNLLQDGQTFTVSDGVTTLTFEFNLASSQTAAGFQRIQFATTDAAYVTARNIVAAINAAYTAGKFKVTAQQSDGTNSGTSSTDPNVNLVNAVSVSPLTLPYLTVTLNKSSISQASGTTSGFVTRQGDLSKSLTVNLSAVSVASQLNVLGTDFKFYSDPAFTTAINTISFVAGSAVSAPFYIKAIPNPAKEGEQSDAVSASANGYTSVSGQLDITGYPTNTLALSAVGGGSLPAAKEAGAVVTGLVTRQTVGTINNSAVTVSITSLSPSRLTILTPIVVIPAGQTSAQFTYQAPEDFIPGDSTSVLINASVNGFQSTQAPVTVTDSGNSKLIPQTSNNVDVTQLPTFSELNGSIVIDKASPNFQYAVSNVDAAGLGGGGGVVVSVSSDGGLTWTNPPNAVASLPNGQDILSDAQLAGDEFGNLFLSYITPTGVVLAISTNHGQTFTQVGSTIFPVLSSSLDAKPTLALAAHEVNGVGSVWFAVADGTNPQISVYGFKTTGFNIYNSIPTVITAINAPNGAEAPSLAIGPTGQVLLAYEEPSSPFSSTGDIKVALNAGGLSSQNFSQPVKVGVTNLVANFFNSSPQISAMPVAITGTPSVAWDLANNIAYVAYASGTTPIPNNNIGIYVTRNITPGNFQQWQSPSPIVDDSTGNSHVFPRIAVDNKQGSATQGDVVVVWYDGRNSVNNSTLQVYASDSVDKGASFSKNVQISSGVINANAGEFNGAGGHIGLDFWNGTFAPLWADNGTTIGNVNAGSAMDEATIQGKLVLPPTLPTATVTFSGGPFIAGNVYPNAGTITLFQPPPAGQTVTVTLTSSNTKVVGLGTSSFTFTAGQTTKTFTLNAPANTSGIAYGIQTAIVSAAVGGYQAVNAAVDVVDSTPAPALTLTLHNSLVTAGGAVVATVTRNTPNNQPLLVTLYSTAPSLTNMPSTVIIPAGQNFVQFLVNGVLANNTIDQTVQIVASSAGLASSSQWITARAQRPVNYDTNNTFFGDQNVVLPQGRLQIIDNSIFNSKNTGISVKSAPRDAGSNNPHPGSVRNLPTINTLDLVPGVNIVNNIVANFGTNGILFSGDSDPAGQPIAAVPYGRIVNNTIYGGSAPIGTGINVGPHAAPTLMNNIIANTKVGVSVDPTSVSGKVNNTVVPLTFEVTSLFQGNSNNGIVGSNAIALAAGAPLFVNPSANNFYLTEGSLAIDSSLNSTADNPQIDAVLSSIGLPAAPIVAPLTDRFGQLRVDDPNVPNAQGLGQNIFIDRGAVERADFTGPTSQLTMPLDNGPDDGNPAINSVSIILPTPITEFDVQLLDVGSGIDNTTVSTTDFVFTQQDPVTLATKTLVDGTDYKFVYNATTHTARFEAISTFPIANNYTISIPKINGALPIRDLAGNPIQPNQPNGTVLFTVKGNHPPSLTGFVNLPQQIENIATTITYQQLLNSAQPANLGVVAGDIPDFLITSIPNGTLTIKKSGSNSYIAIQTGSTVANNKSNLVQPGDTLLWNPGANVGPAVTAFNALAYDETNAKIAPALSMSAPPPVPANFTVVDPTPVLSKTSMTLGVGAPSTKFPVTFSTLVSGLGASWFKATGNQQEFKITANNDPANLGLVYLNNTLIPAGTTVTMLPTDQVFWIPPTNLPAPPPVATTTIFGAFTVNAYDTYNTSTFPPPYNTQYSTSVATGTVNISAINVPPPTLGNQAVTIALQPQNVPTPISYQTLVSLTNSKIGYPGDELAFRLESLPASPQGTLYINNVAITPAMVATHTVFIRSVDNVVWIGANKLPTSNVPPGTTVPAFTISAYDYTYGLDGFVNSNVSINLVNVAPTQSNPITIPGLADQQTNFDIKYLTLLGASGATDANGDVISFKIITVPANGTLTITKAGSNTITAVTPGTTVVAQGDVLHWVANLGVVGPTPAFVVAATDGVLTSASSPVNINVRALGSAFDLSGTWLVDNPGGAAVGIGRIAQSGANLPTILNYTGIGTTGVYTSLNTIKAVSLDGVSNLVGTVDMNTPDFGRIVWADGAIWLRLSLGGTWAVTTGNTTTLGNVSQNNNVVSFTGGNSPFNATIGFNVAQSQVVIQLPNNTTVPFTNNSFSAYGQTWKKLDLPTNYNSSFGGTASVVQNGSATLQLTNNLGQTSPGFWTSATTISATAWNITGTVGNGQVSWSNGDVWSEVLSLTGTKNNTPGKTTLITVTAPTAVLPAGPTVLAFQNHVNGSQKEYVIRYGTSTALFVDEAGNQALGTLQNNGLQAIIPAWNNTIATFGLNKITFSQAVPGGSSQWDSIPLTTSPFTVNSYLNSTTAKPEYVITNSGNTNATFINDAGLWVQGTVSGTTATAAALNLGTGTLSSGIITWSTGPTVWVQTTVQANVVSSSSFYNAANGNAEQMISNGNYRIFINDTGSAAFGVLNNAGTKATIAAWNQIATFAANSNITFATTAAPNTVIATWVKTASLQPLVTMTNTDGTTFHVRVTSSTTFVVIDGTAAIPAGTVGTRNSRLITWSNNSAAWNNFDFNGLNSLFQMGAGYP